MLYIRYVRYMKQKVSIKRAYTSLTRPLKSPFDLERGHPRIDQLRHIVHRHQI